MEHPGEVAPEEDSLLEVDTEAPAEEVDPDAERLECVVREIVQSTEARRLEISGSRRFTVVVGLYSAAVEEPLRDCTEFGSATPLFGVPDTFPTASFSKLSANVQHHPTVSSSCLRSLGVARTSRPCGSLSRPGTFGGSSYTGPTLRR